MTALRTLGILSLSVGLAACSSSGTDNGNIGPTPTAIGMASNTDSSVTPNRCGIAALISVPAVRGSLTADYKFFITENGKTTALPDGRATNAAVQNSSMGTNIYQVPATPPGSLGVPIPSCSTTPTYLASITLKDGNGVGRTTTIDLGHFDAKLSWPGYQQGSAKYSLDTKVVHGTFMANATSKDHKPVTYSFKLSGEGTVTHKQGSNTFTVNGAAKGETVTITATSGNSKFIGKAIPVTAENILAVNADVKTSAVTQVNLSNPGKADGVDQFATIDLSAKTLAVTQNANAQGYYLTNGNLTAKTYSQYASLINSLKKPVSLQLTAKSLADADAVTQAASLLTNAQDVVVIPVTAKNIADVATAASKLQAQHLGFVLQLPLGDHAATCDLLNSIAPYMKNTSYRGIYLQPVGDVDMSSIALVNQFLKQPSICINNKEK